MTELIRSVVHRHAPHHEVRCIQDETEALAHVLQTSASGEAIVCFCEDIDLLSEAVMRAGGSPLTDGDVFRTGLLERLPVSA